MNRAATFVRWAPLENKFAVGSSAKVISVCSYEADNDFWVSKHLKRSINSTITCLDWHPDNNILACGSTDFHVRVFSAYVKSNDSAFKESNWGTKLTFNTLLWESEGGRKCFTRDEFVVTSMANFASGLGAFGGVLERWQPVGLVYAFQCNLRGNGRRVGPAAGCVDDSDG